MEKTNYGNMLKLNLLNPMNVAGRPGMVLEQVGNDIVATIKADNRQEGRIYSANGVCPTITRTKPPRIMVCNEAQEIPNGYAPFVEDEFLSVLNHIVTRVCVNRAGDLATKNLVSCVARHCRFDQNDVLGYLKSILETRMGSFMSKKIDKAALRRISAHFGLAGLDSVENCPSSVLAEVYIDSVGWIKMVDILLEIAQEKRIRS